VFAIRRTLAGGWGKPRPVSGLHTFRAGIATLRQWWQAPTSTVRPRRRGVDISNVASRDLEYLVRQPEDLRLGSRAIDMDAQGHAMVAWWDGPNLTGRLSRPDGCPGRNPCFITANASRPSSWDRDPQVVMNRHGDTLMRWRAKSHMAQLWSR
jgi:hypothetical protein